MQHAIRELNIIIGKQHCRFCLNNFHFNSLFAFRNFLVSCLAFLYVHFFLATKSGTTFNMAISIPHRQQCSMFTVVSWFCKFFSASGYRVFLWYYAVIFAYKLESIQNFGFNCHRFCCIALQLKHSIFMSFEFQTLKVKQFNVTLFETTRRIKFYVVGLLTCAHKNQILPWM